MADVYLVPFNGSTTNCAAADTIAKATAGLVKAGPCNLYRLIVTNTNAAAQFYALVDKATAPTTGDTPLMYFAVAASATFPLEYTYGKHFTLGCGWAQVTTPGAATITTTTSDTLVSAEVK